MIKVVNLYKDKYDVYIGRGTEGKVPINIGTKGWLGNPFDVETYGDQAIPKFKEYFYNRIATDEAFKNAVLALKGKTLGCFCKPKPCHGDIIMEYLESQ